MTGIFHRHWRLAASLILGVALCGSVASAAIQMATGIRYIVASGSPADCGTKAQTALSTYLLNTHEATPGSGEWIAVGSKGITGPPTAAATVHCYPVGKGYVVTFTCVVQQPGNPYASDALCLDVAHNFSGKPVTALATPTPIPTGCNTVNLAGTWVSDDPTGPKFTMDLDGSATDADGVNGNWALDGRTVTLTYYGNHTLTLSPDGKHINGKGFSLTRKC